MDLWEFIYRGLVLPWSSVLIQRPTNISNTSRSNQPIPQISQSSRTMLRSQGLGQSAASQRRRKEYRCDEINTLTGQCCNKTFPRTWNLKRHKLDLHGDKETVFINYVPTPATGIQLPRIQALNLPASVAPMQGPAATQPTLTPWRLAPSTIRASPCPSSPSSFSSSPSPPPPRASVAPMQTPAATQPTLASWRLAPSTFSPSPCPSSTSSPSPSPPSPSPRLPAPEVMSASSLSLTENRTFESNPRIPDTPVQAIHQSRRLARSAVPVTSGNSNLASRFEEQFSQSDAIENRTPSPTGWTGQLEEGSESDGAISETSEHCLGSRLRTSNEGSGCSCRKRKRSTTTGRVIDAEMKADIPAYLVKRSKKTPGQQRGLDWLSAEGKDHFDSTLETLLAQWGVKAKHRGTCVLLPEDWKALDPAELMAIFDDHQPPSGGSSRACYSYSDHATSLARAAAWYGGWPRRAAELDQFLGCGPWMPKDGSHLCHHEHCIVHLVYESAAVNWDRWNCCLEARFLRQDGREVPEHCTKHSPPCLMQHAALTTRETYYIQFAVLRQAKHMPSTLPIPRPRRYQYPTLESQLPGSFPAITIDPDDLVEETLPAKKEGRPDLLCPFCPHIKAYATPTAYWAHLVHKHKDVDDQSRLGEVRRTGRLWREYWDQYSDGGKYNNPTMAKLLQIEGEEFCWQNVLDWNLR